MVQFLMPPHEMVFDLLVQFAHLRHLDRQLLVLTHHVVFLTCILLHEQLVLMEADIIALFVLKPVTAFAILSHIICLSLAFLVLLKIFCLIVSCIVILRGSCSVAVSSDHGMLMRCVVLTVVEQLRSCVLSIVWRLRALVPLAYSCLLVLLQWDSLPNGLLELRC